MFEDNLKDLRVVGEQNFVDGRYSDSKKPIEYLLILGQEIATYTFFNDLFSKYFNLVYVSKKSEAIEALNNNKNIVVAILDLKSFKEGAKTFKDFFEAARKSFVSTLVIAAGDIIRENADLLRLGATDIVRPPLVKELLLCRINNLTFIHEVTASKKESINYAAVLEQQKEFSCLIDHDDLTGLLNRKGFYSYMTYILNTNKDKKRYLVGVLDVDDFKVVNYLKGVEVGDELLKGIADCLLSYSDGQKTIFSRFENDHFYFLFELDTVQPEIVLKGTQNWISKNSLFFTLGLRMGVYYVKNDEPIDAARDCQKALFALQTIKGSFVNRIAYYNDRIYDRVINEQQLTSEMVNALAKKQFEIYYQPQYNYETNEVCGAEALIRWNHPTLGLLMPGKFIPLFERNGFILQLDQFVWEGVCAQIAEWVRKYGEEHVPPVSVNISRFDIYHFNVVEFLKSLVVKYGIPVKLLRVEITESSYMVEPERLLKIVKELMDYGLLVEMDDFGSAYSSLNMLKDIPVNVLKLDLKFLSGQDEEGRSGTILTSIIRMAHWLKLPIIAEGVETKNQADYLKSIGVTLMQGYHFSKPIQMPSYEALFVNANVTHGLKNFNFDSKNDVEQFLDASNQTALVFNTYVGGAIIIQRFNNTLEILRANDMFFKNLGTTRKEYEEFLKDFSVRFDEKNKDSYNKMLDYSMTHEESYACEIYDDYGVNRVKNSWTRNRARYLGRIVDGDFFYVAVENITKEKEAINEIIKQKEVFSKLYNGVQCGIVDYVVDINKEIQVLKYNDTAWRLFGFKNVIDFDKEISGQKGLHFVHPDGYQFVRQTVLSVNEDGKERTIECRGLLTDGTYHWFELRIYSAKFDNRNAIEIIFIDVNDRHLSYNWKGLKVLISIFRDLDLYNFSNHTLQKISDNYVYNEKIVVLDKLEERVYRWIDECFSYDPKLKEEVKNNFTLNNLNRICKENGSYQIEFKMFDNSDKKMHFFRSTIYKIEENTFISCCLDITKQIDAQETKNKNIALQAIVDEQEKYRIVIEQAEIAVFEMDYTKNQFSASENYKKYAMSQQDQGNILANTGDLSLVHNDDLPALFKFFSESQDKNRTESEALLRLKMTTGEFRWTRMRAKYIRDKDGNNLKTIGTFIDVNDDVVGRKKLVAYKNELELIIENIPSGIIVLDFDENIKATPLYISDKALQIFGYTKEDRTRVLNKPMVMENLFSDRLKHHEYLENIASNKDFMIPDASIQRGDGAIVSARCILKHVTNQERTVWYIIVLENDNYMIERKNKVDVDEIYSLLSYSIKTIIVDYNVVNDEIVFHFSNSNNERIERKVKKFTKYLYSPECFILEKYRSGMIQKLRNALLHETYENYEFEGTALDGEVHWFRFRFSSLEGKTGIVYRIIGCLDNFDDVMIEQKKEVRKAMVDEITLLSNKDLGRQLMDEALNQKKPDEVDAMIFFDIDYFKKINDNYGHLDADVVLGNVGKAINKVFDNRAIASRFGGDEFIVFLRDVKDKDTVTELIKKLFKEIHKIKLRDGKRISISLGCRLIDENFPNYEDIFRNADMALYASKQHGKNQYHYFADVDIKTFIK